MKPAIRYLLIVLTLGLASLACQAAFGEDNSPTESPQATLAPTRLPVSPVQPGEASPDEPVYITGEIAYTSPFFETSLSTGFVLLEEQTGFTRRDEEFVFPLAGQVMGPVEKVEDGLLQYSLLLPGVPLATMVDVDQDGTEDAGVQVFAIAYWSNTWEGPFLDKRDGRGWSGSYVSTVVNSDRRGEIEGGILVVWAPDDQQSFPTGFGEDQELFTEDDPVAPISAGYSLVDLNEEPFGFSKVAQPVIDLYEGSGAVIDYSDMDYVQAFDELLARVSREYPFTAEKNMDWDALIAEFRPWVEDARNDRDFYEVLLQLTYAIPDGHVGLGFDENVAPQYFYEKFGGGFGMNLAELSDGTVIVTNILPGFSAEQAGLRVGAEIIRWDGLPILEAIDQVQPYFGSYSTLHTARLAKVQFLTRTEPDAQIEVEFQNPGEAVQTITLGAEVEYDSIFSGTPIGDELDQPIESEVLDESGLGYIRINTFLEDYYLMARLWEWAVQGLLDNGVTGLIIDIRQNGGGSGGLAGDFAAYFHDQEVVVYDNYYYNNLTGQFETWGVPSRIEPAPLFYDGEIALLIGPDCVSACEGFAYMVQLNGRTTVVGHYPTAGAYGEVGQGQYKLPGEFEMQFPTGRPETPDGAVLIEGTGIVPDILVPVTAASALGDEDLVLLAAIEALTQ